MEEKKSWLACNILYLLSIGVVVVWAVSTIILEAYLIGIVKASGEVDNGTIMSFYGQVTTGTFGTVLAYFFTSSVNSRAKDETIKELSKTSGS